MSEGLTEIKSIAVKAADNIEALQNTFAELRSEVNEMKGSVPKDPITQEKWDRMSASITEQLEATQKEQAEIKAALSRPGSGKDKSKEAEKKAAEAFDTFMRKGIDLKGVDRSDGKFAIEIRPETKAMSTDVNPDGGYLVRPEFISERVTRAWETSPMRNVARTLQGSTKSIEMLIDDDEFDVNSVGEGASGGETDTAELGLKEIVAHKYEATPKVTTEQLQDSYFDVEAWIADHLDRKFGRKENTDFFTGTGVNTAKGILTFSAWTTAGTYERGKIEQVNLGAAAALTAPGLLELQYALPEMYQPGASWFMKRATFGKALQLKGNDAFFFAQNLMRDGQATAILLGKPVLFADDMPAVGANALSVAYGDFSVGYTIYDRIGMQMLRDPYSSHGYVEFYTTKRTGGDVTAYDAIKIGKVAA